MSRVLAAIAEHARATPDTPALVGADITLSWVDLRDEVARTAAWLSDRLAAAPADAPVGVGLDNGPAWVVIDLALMTLGRPSVPLPAFFTPQQGLHGLGDPGACLLIRTPATADTPSLGVAGASSPSPERACSWRSRSHC